MNALHRLTLALAAAATLATAAPAAAQEAAEEGYASMAVQNRRYAQRHEFDAHFGVLPLDAFTKGLTLSGSYTFHPTNLFAWEVLHGLKSFHLYDDLVAFLPCTWIPDFFAPGSVWPRPAVLTDLFAQFWSHLLDV